MLWHLTKFFARLVFMVFVWVIVILDFLLINHKVFCRGKDFKDELLDTAEWTWHGGER